MAMSRAQVVPQHVNLTFQQLMDAERERIKQRLQRVEEQLKAIRKLTDNAVADVQDFNNSL